MVDPAARINLEATLILLMSRVASFSALGERVNVMVELLSDVGLGLGLADADEDEDEDEDEEEEEVEEEEEEEEEDEDEGSKMGIINREDKETKETKETIVVRAFGL